MVVLLHDLQCQFAHLEIHAIYAFGNGEAIVLVSRFQRGYGEEIGIVVLVLHHLVVRLTVDSRPRLLVVGTFHRPVLGIALRK